MTLDLSDGSEVSFYPAQFHFHAPSEHLVEGYKFDLEVHFVHLPEDGFQDDAYASVIGVFFDRVKGGNEDNYFIDSLFGSGPETVIPIEDFLSGIDTSEFWSYPGSLTTPPCTEGIKWNVIKSVQPISDRQLKYFTDLWQND